MKKLSDYCALLGIAMAAPVAFGAAAGTAVEAFHGRSTTAGLWALTFFAAMLIAMAWEAWQARRARQALRHAERDWSVRMLTLAADIIDDSGRATFGSDEKRAIRDVLERLKNAEGAA